MPTDLTGEHQRQLLLSAVDITGRRPALAAILQERFTAEERAEVVRELAREYLPGMPVPDPVPEAEPDTWSPDGSWDDPAPVEGDDGGKDNPAPVWHVLEALGPDRPPHMAPDAEPFAAIAAGGGPVVYWRYRA